MQTPDKRTEYVSALSLSANLQEQDDLRRRLQGDDYHADVLQAYLMNPFLRLSDDELAHVRRGATSPELSRLIEAREAACRSRAPKYAVFCMPKSGSSFVQSALQYALELPFVSLTTFGTPRTSTYFGMNSREQEIDELAVIKATLGSPQGFVAQHHTRYSAYLALQLRAYGITPIVTTRNVLDCIVSFDDMILAADVSSLKNRWLFDPQFPLPANYRRLDAPRRYEVLAQSLGPWLLGFYLSWKRGSGLRIAAPVRLVYEETIADRERFVETVSGALALTEAQAARLRRYAAAPDRRRSRFNVGVAGRGRALVPGAVKQSLADYARAFGDEIGEDEIRQLIE